MISTKTRFPVQTPYFLAAQANIVPTSFHVQAYHDIFICPADPSCAGLISRGALQGLSRSLHHLVCRRASLVRADRCRGAFRSCTGRLSVPIPGRPSRYSTTDGYRPLREYIAARYRRRLGVPATADEIQITNGSQQCLDLFAKIFLNAGDRVGMERPGYLGAIEAFSLYEPVFETVPLDSEGPDMAAFGTMIKKTPVKFFYGIPNSQNPSGCTYSEDRRREIAEIINGTDTVFYEDDAFGELFFDGKPRLPVKRRLPEQSVISGSFSKITAPGMRIGWLYAPKEILSAFNTVKQAADLHSNFLCQQILYRYLTTHDLDAHIHRIVEIYGQAVPADVRSLRRPDACPFPHDSRRGHVPYRDAARRPARDESL